MGRKGKYETHVEPRLHEVSKWICTMTEGQIASKLGITDVRLCQLTRKIYGVTPQQLIEGLKTKECD